MKEEPFDAIHQRLTSPSFFHGPLDFLGATVAEVTQHDGRFNFDNKTRRSTAKLIVLSEIRSNYKESDEYK